MNDLISRQAAIEALARMARGKFNLSDEFNHYCAGLMDGEMAIRRLPSAVPDAVPVVHGKWIYEGARGRFPACRCSVCGNVENADWAMISGEVNFCPNCGARMDGEDDEMPGL